VGGRERTQWGEDGVYAADAEFAGQISFNIVEHVLPAYKVIVHRSDRHGALF